MTDQEAARFADEWIENFNRRDLAGVLRHFAEEATFRSPRAAAFAGRPTLNSREELAAYWGAALRSVGRLHFTLDRVINDPESRSLVILYVAEIDAPGVRAAEIYRFNEASRIISGEAMYGATL